MASEQFAVATRMLADAGTTDDRRGLMTPADVAHYRQQRGLLLLTHDLQLDGRDLQVGGPDLQLDGEQLARHDNATQPPLPGFDHLVTPKIIARVRRQGRSKRPPVDDPLYLAYQARLAAQGRAVRGQQAYCYQLRFTVRVAERIGGRPVSYADLLRDEALLGLALVDDAASRPGVRLSKWTLAQRRSAWRSFVTLMRPELLELLDDEPGERLDRALRVVAERVGAGYRLTGGSPRRRGGRAPSRSQIQTVIAEVGSAAGFVGARNRAFFTILAETGCRVNALRLLDGADCIMMPSGRLRLLLHEKGKAEPREVELSQAAATALQGYAEEFNYLAAFRRWQARIRLGAPGAVWRNSGRGCWPYDDIRATLKRGCTTADVPPFSPHAFRRAFATEAASVLPRHTVAQAGGWKGLERLDDHYVQPRHTTIWEKLGRRNQAPVDRPWTAVGHRDAALPV